MLSIRRSPALSCRCVRVRASVPSGVLPEAGFKGRVVGGRPQVDEAFLDAYRQQTDARVLDAFCAAPEGTVVRDLDERLRDRRLLRQTHSVWLDQYLEQLDDARFAFIRDPDEFTRERIEAIEAQIADELDLPAHLVAVFLDARTNSTYIYA